MHGGRKERVRVPGDRKDSESVGQDTEAARSLQGRQPEAARLYIPPPGGTHTPYRSQRCTLKYAPAGQEVRESSEIPQAPAQRGRRFGNSVSVNQSFPGAATGSCSQVFPKRPGQRAETIPKLSIFNLKSQ